MLDLEKLRTEDEYLKAILEYYFREYFKRRKDAIQQVYKENPAVINKEYSLKQLEAEIEEVIQEATDKVNMSLLLILDLYSLGYRKDVRDFEYEFVELLNSKILAPMKQALTDMIQGIYRIH